MTYSNLSKIQPKLRTTGRVSGNFGRNKVKTNGNNELGLTEKKNINVTRKSEYINRMYQVLDTTTDRKIQQFAYDEIRKYLIQTNQW